MLPTDYQAVIHESADSFVIEPYFTKKYELPVESCRDVRINSANGGVIYEQKNVLAPPFWSDTALSIVASRYFRGNGAERESSISGLIDRVVSTIVKWGIRGGYFQDGQGKIFANELTYILNSQMAFFNSPVWFNLGWPNRKQAITACYILPVEDSMFSILDLYKTEGLIFKDGSGAGVNMSPLRSSKENLMAGGKSSGPVSFMRGLDASAGSIKSGGSTRRAALMRVLDVNHPDIIEFIQCKAIAERQAHDLIACGWNGAFDDPYGAYSVPFQNANHSVRVDGTFLQAVRGGLSFPLRYVLSGKVDQEISAGKIMEEICQAAWSCGDPGLQFGDTINRYHKIPHMGEIVASNPCLTYETLVFTADGRGGVPIGKLAEEGKDVPVFCLGEGNRLSIRMMRHPRLTRENVPIKKITLDDGCVIRCTNNHRFMLRNGVYIEADNLQPGDSLRLVTRYIPNIHDKRQNRAYRYNCIQGGRKEPYWEHVEIASFYHGIDDLTGLHVHHKNKNRFDNHPENLGIQASAAHLSGHFAGEENPRYLNIKNEEFIQHGRSLVRKLRKRFSINDWQMYAKENNLPIQFSQWRRKYLGSLATFSKKCAELEGVVDHLNEDPRLVTSLLRFLDMGLGAEISDGGIIIHRECEHCHSPFVTTPQYRERSFCSRQCWAKMEGAKSIDKQKANQALTFQKRRENLAHLQVDIFLALRNQLQREPMKKEWSRECHLRGVSTEMNRPSSPFTSWDRLKTSAEDVNHRVVRVEDDGYADVYNGTVEDYHNYLVGGWHGGTSKNERSKEWWIVSANCGEYLQVSGTSCNLASLNLLKFLKDGKFQREDFLHVVRVMILAQEIMVGQADYPTKEIEENTKASRSLGLGFSNLGSFLMSLAIPYDSPEARLWGSGIASLLTAEAYRTSALIAGAMGPFDWYDPAMLEVIDRYRRKSSVDLGAEYIWNAAYALGEKHGFRNAEVSCIAPTGTISLAMDCETTGIEPAFGLVSYKTLVGGGTLKLTNSSVLTALQKLYSQKEAQEIHSCLERDGSFKNSTLRPEHLSIFDCALPLDGRYISPEGHLKMLAAVQQFISMGVSKTINMPEESTVADIQNIYMQAYDLGIKAISIYRDGSKKTQPLNIKKESPIISQRRRLPDTCQAVRHKFSIGGHEGYIHVGLYGDGFPGEIFVNIAKEGSTLAGVFDSLATVTSIALQHGVPLELLVEKLSHARYEPSGFTTNDKVKFASSITDYIFRWLAEEFQATPAVEQVISDVPTCPQCGGMTKRSGTCYVCMSCGGTTGGCS